VDVAEAVQRLHLSRLLAGGSGGGQRLLVEADGILVMAVAAKVPVKGGRQMQQVCWPVMRIRMPRSGQ
jgi:hypothetical protein